KARAKYSEPMPVREEDIPFFKVENIHDSRIVSAERLGDTFTLTLDSVWDQDFFHDLSIHLNRDLKIPEIPIDLVFQEVSYMRWMRHNKQGDLRFFRPEFKPPRSDGGGIDTFLYGWFEQEGGSLQWLAQINTFQPPQHRFFDSDIFLGIDCKKATATDRRRSVIEKLLGTEIADIWTEYRSTRDPVMLDREDLCKFLEESNIQ
ncbi:MAG TPA: hypothetical protein VK171_02475, partial [Fimbriimonas sp.]|nr:hypothetical protein [Fimbriimonas sp.]